MKQNSKGPDWAKLEKIGNEKAKTRPSTIGEWQKMFGDIYKVDSTGSYSIIFARFSEELGELAEALRVFPIAPGYFLSEAADVFAWLMHLQNKIEKVSGLPVAERGKLLSQVLQNSYPDYCVDCGRAICACPAILPSTLGRIAHEVPRTRSVDVDDALLTLDDALTLFGLAQTEVELNGVHYDLDREQLRVINAGVTQLIRLVVDQGRDLGAHSALLVDCLHELKGQTDSLRVSDAQLEQLVSIVSSLEPARREKVLSLVRDTSIGVLTGGFVAAVQTVATG